MILVESIQVREVPGDYVKVFQNDSLPFPPRPGVEGMMACREEAAFELVRGQEFVDPRTRERVTIGFTEKVGETLRLPLKAFRDMSHDISELHSQNTRLTIRTADLEKKLRRGYEEFEAFAGMPWYKRLLFLFVGRRMYNDPSGD